LLVNYMRSFCSDYLKLKAQLLDDEFGKVQKICVYYTKGIMHNGSHPMDLLLDWFGEPDSMHVTHAFLDYTPDDPTIDACLMFGDIPVYFMGLDESKFSYFEMAIFTGNAQISLAEFGKRLVIRRVDSILKVGGHRVLGSPDERDTKLVFAMADSLSSLVKAIQGHEIEINGLRALKALELTSKLADLGKEKVCST